MIQRIKEKLEQYFDPHREYMGERVYRTKVFWSEVFHIFIGAFIFSQTQSYALVAGAMVGFHILDFCFWYVQENLFNFNPMKGSIGRK